MTKAKDKEQIQKSQIVNEIVVSSLTIGNVSGDTAHDAADSGSPLKIGGKAHTSEPAAVANNDRVNAYFDANGYLMVKSTLSAAASNLVDTNNSTTTPLGGGATFTGTGTDVSPYAAVAVTLYSDVDSGASGMTFQFSTDNSNWDDVHSFTMDVSDSDTRRFQFPVTAQYFRVVYTNGGGGQGAFRVQTILHRNNILTSIHNVGAALTTDRSAQLVRAVIAGETTAGGGSMVNVKVSPSGALTMEAEQATHDNLNANVNLQVGDSDVSTGNPVPVSSKVALTASSPTFDTVGVASAEAVASNGSRTGLVLINTSANTISLGLGAAAVMNRGITLNASGGTWVMDEYTFTTSAVNAIASAGSSNLAIQEFT